MFKVCLSFYDQNSGTQVPLAEFLFILMSLQDESSMLTIEFNVSQRTWSIDLCYSKLWFKINTPAQLSASTMSSIGLVSPAVISTTSPIPG
jgi:hypothetical protein